MAGKIKSESARDRLLAAAAKLLAEQGVSVSTRAICELAGVTAPTLYHYFGDRDGLLQAVVSHGFSEYLERKKSIEVSGDPIEDIRRGWIDHQEWGVEHPSFYALMYGQVRPGQHHVAGDEGEQLLLEKLDAAARRGLLRVPPSVACHMILSANIGLTLQLISQPEWGDGDVSSRVFDALMAGILQSGASTAGTEPWPTAVSAIALRAALAADPAPALDATELPLLGAWLDRLATVAPR
ncbi:MAG TPA: TetR/AcrR family transcriptional regulator [Galbitalea sp.]|jgi:AcrR family transcriptional regulator